MNIVKRLLKFVFFLFITILFIGWSYRVIADWQDRSDFPAPGNLYSVNGADMHLHCVGEGQPTVVLEQGLGHAAVAWRPIQEELAKVTRTCSYDRRGLGHSERLGDETRASEVASNLNQLLLEAGIDDDLILVGWSAGGVYAREFFHAFPEKLRGMVLIDSSHEQQALRFAEANNLEPEDGINWQLVLYKYGGAVGLVRALKMHDNAFASTFEQMNASPQFRAEVLAQYNQFDHISSRVDESNSFDLDIKDQTPPKQLGNLPLIVISRGQPDINSGTDDYGIKREAAWKDMQIELAKLSTNSRHVIAQESNHNIPFMQPNLVIQLITEMVGQSQ